MTFAEKARKEHPERVDFELGYPPRDCPYLFGYEEVRTPSHCVSRSCKECWNREIPEEKPKTRSKQQKIADYLWNTYVAFQEAGFDKAQAFDLTKVVYEVMVKESYKS